MIDVDTDAPDGDAGLRQEQDAVRRERGYASSVVAALHDLAAAIEYTDFEKARTYATMIPSTMDKDRNLGVRKHLLRLASDEHC
jgi:hypothetical protein